MDILVIGNGFDLAHKLPTMYTDFFEFCKVVLCLYDEDKMDMLMEECWEELGIEVSCRKKELKELFISVWNKRKIVSSRYKAEGLWWPGIITNTYMDEIFECISKPYAPNLWIYYFAELKVKGKNWIDFEKEISNVIKVLDRSMHNNQNGTFQLDDWLKELDNTFFYKIYISGAVPKKKKWSDKEFSTFRDVRDRLYRDLNRLIRALELYLTEYIEKLECALISPDIEKIAKTIFKAEGGKDEVTYGRVISFNYTNTYERIYLEKKNLNVHIDYIHGKAKCLDTIENNNMVLGIDEYLPSEKKDCETEFIVFKKFYQKIYKETGYIYKEWLEDIQEEYQKYLLNYRRKRESTCMIHHVYIFGHSLDVTDKDVFRDLILNDNVYTTIFYLNKNIMGQQIENLVKIIGQDELIRRTSGKTKNIEFKKQQDMIENRKGTLVL